MASFQDFPTELAVEIFTHLDYIILIKLSQTCRFFNTIITTENSGPLGVILLRCRSNDNGPFPSPSPSASSSTEEKYRCFELHPCIVALSLDLRKNHVERDNENKNEDKEDLVGFFNETANTFRPLSSYSLLPNEKLFYNTCIPIAGLFRLQQANTDKQYVVLLATSIDAATESITVGEFVARLSEQVFNSNVGTAGVLQLLQGLADISTQSERDNGDYCKNLPSGVLSKLTRWGGVIVYSVKRGDI